MSHMMCCDARSMAGRESGQTGQKQANAGKSKGIIVMASGSANGTVQGRGRPRIRPFLQTAAQRMEGGFDVGQDVLVRWSDGLFYSGQVLRVDEGNDRCQIQFEDKSTYYVLIKDIHNVPAEGEISCCICQGETSEEPNKIVLCDSCGMGYHQHCHNPPIPDSVLLPHVTFLCKLCVFASRVQHGGSSKLASGDPVCSSEEQVLNLPYKMNLLTWDAQHKTNVEQCYCYCGGPGDWYCKMLQCCRCRQWFHEACVRCLREPLLYGDRFFMFVCSHCNHGQEYIKRLPFKWVEIVHLALFNMTLLYSHKYYDLDTDLLPWLVDQAENLQVENLLDGQPVFSPFVRYKMESALNGHKSKFVSGREVKKRATWWALIVRIPPHPPSISVPVSGFISDEVMDNLNGRGRKVKFISPAQCQTPVTMKCVSRSRLDPCLSIMFQCLTKKKAHPEANNNNNRLLNGFSPNQCYNGYTGTNSLPRFNGNGFHLTNPEDSSTDDDEPRPSRKKTVVRRLRTSGKTGSNGGDAQVKNEPEIDGPGDGDILDRVVISGKAALPASKKTLQEIKTTLPEIKPLPETVSRASQGRFGLLDSIVVPLPHFEGQNHPFKTDVEKEADVSRVQHFESRISHLKKEYASELAAIKISENLKQEESPAIEKLSKEKPSPGKSKEKASPGKSSHDSADAKQQRGTKRKLSVDTDSSSQDSVRRSKRSRQHAERYQHLLASFPRHAPRGNNGQGSRWKWLSVVDQLRHGEKFEVLARRVSPQGQVEFLLHWNKEEDE